MTLKEIEEETNSIAAIKTEVWNNIFENLSDKEFVKLNHLKVCESTENLCWYLKIENHEKLQYSPFGFLCADFFNQLNSLQSKEKFISYEKRMRTPKAEGYNPTFDKKFRLFFWNYSEIKYDAANNMSDEELESMYNEHSWLWEYIKKEVTAITQLLKYSSQAQIHREDILQTYFNTKSLILKISMLREKSDILSKNNLDKLRKEWILKGYDEIIYDPSIVDQVSVSRLRYIGYDLIECNDDSSKKQIFCKNYDVPDIIFLVPEDLLYCLLHQTTHSFKVCPECDCMFVTLHGNQKHCPACNQIIRLKQRRENKERYLHKNITDYINNYRNDGSENASEAFRRESNYYWAIVQGKEPKTIKEVWYSNKIKTKDDYMKWLKKKYEEVKNTK